MAKSKVEVKDIQALREKTGAGFTLCKEALESSGGDAAKAMDYIRKKGSDKAAKRAERSAKEGVIGIYHHGVDQKVAAIVELNCETDFVAKNESFRELAHELAMQVAAMRPEYVDIQSVPKKVINKEKEIIRESDDLKGKPDNVVDKIVEGKLQKFYAENCLLEQEHFKDPEKKIKDLLDEAVASIGEKIVVSQIYRMEVGG